MTILAFLIGIGLPTVIGWFSLRLLENAHPVLFRLERWVLGFVLGTTLTMYVATMANIVLRIPFSLWGFLITHGTLIALLGMLWRKRNVRWMGKQSIDAPESPALAPWMKIIIGILGAWTAIKIIGAFAMLVGLPPYFDDVLDNWNLRGKVFYLTQRYALQIPLGGEMVEFTSVNAYPTTVSLLKTWLATLAGEWNEGLANAPHILWYLSCIACVYFFLRRRVTIGWSLLGAYMLSSLPLPLMHATSSYADIMLASHVLIALGLLFIAIREDDPGKRMSTFRLGAFATALLIFTKNEALVLHLPVMLLLLGINLFMLWNRKHIGLRDARAVILTYALCIAAVAIPWMAFKWLHDLPFGNAKGIPLEYSWQPGILRAIFISTFLEGNWNLLFPLFFGCIALTWRSTFRSSVGVLVTYALLLLLAQSAIYLFTGLGIEALNQTGQARGFVQIVPVIVVGLILLLHCLWARNRSLRSPIVAPVQRTNIDNRAS